MLKRSGFGFVLKPECRVSVSAAGFEAAAESRYTVGSMHRPGPQSMLKKKHKTETQEKDPCLAYFGVLGNEDGP